LWKWSKLSVSHSQNSTVAWQYTGSLATRASLWRRWIGPLVFGEFLAYPLKGSELQKHTLPQIEP
jgi:hypothetical protein